MMKMHKMYCSKCGNYAVHNYVGSKGSFEGLGFVRGMLAFTTLGVSETVCRDRYWQCTECGHLKEEEF